MAIASQKAKLAAKLAAEQMAREDSARLAESSPECCLFFGKPIRCSEFYIGGCVLAFCLFLFRPSSPQERGHPHAAKNEDAAWVAESGATAAATADATAKATAAAEAAAKARRWNRNPRPQPPEV